VLVGWHWVGGWSWLFDRHLYIDKLDLCYEFSMAVYIILSGVSLHDCYLTNVSMLTTVGVSV
jgi:hypothetical protein